MALRGAGYSPPLFSLYPQQVQQPLTQYLQPFKGPTSSFEMLQQRGKVIQNVGRKSFLRDKLPSNKLLAWCPRRLKVVGYRFTIENGYLATELIAFCPIYQAAETSVYMDGNRGRLTSKQQTNGCRPSGPGMTGCCFYPTANLHPECVTKVSSFSSRILKISGVIRIGSG
jgi:hypothetical protein